VPGHQVSAHLELIQGSTVRSKHVSQDIMADLKDMRGGEQRCNTEGVVGFLPIVPPG